MSSALPLIVFGQVYFLGQAANNLPVIPNMTPMASPTIYQGQNQPLPPCGIRRSDYTYTAGIGGHKVHAQPATWNKARKTCEEEGGHLAIINSVAESEVIKKLFEDSKPHVDSESSDYVHIGFHSFFEQGEYVTIHGESLTTAGFNEWSDDEPSNNEDEQCGSIYEDGKLNDITCNQTIGFVCEVPYVHPTPVKLL